MERRGHRCKVVEGKRKEGESDGSPATVERREARVHESEEMQGNAGQSDELCNDNHTHAVCIFTLCVCVYRTETPPKVVLDPDMEGLGSVSEKTAQNGTVCMRTLHTLCAYFQ